MSDSKCFQFKMKACIINVKRISLIVLILLNFSIYSCNGAILSKERESMIHKTQLEGLVKNVESRMIPDEHRLKRLAPLPIDGDLENIFRNKREIELMDIEEPEEAKDDEQEGFWTRVARVALNLLRKFMAWMNQ